MKRFLKGIWILMGILGGLPFALHAFEPPSLVDFEVPLPTEHASRTEWGRDPFFREAVKKDTGVVQRETRSGELTLSAIIFRDGTGVAIINDQIVRQGDTIEGGEIRKILSDRVLLRKGGRVVELTVEKFNFR